MAKEIQYMADTMIETGSNWMSGINLSKAGRMASIVGGGALAAYGLATAIKNRSVKGSLPGAAMAVIGGGLAYKAATEKMGADKYDGHNLPYRGGVVIERSVVINKKPDELYQFWRNFENLPIFMEHLISVKVTGDFTSHWAATGPAGIPIEWDAEIINEQPNELIAWRSLESSNIDNTGSVHFQPVDDGAATMVKVVLRYDPPGRNLGAAFARLFHEEPGIQVSEDLLRFKQLIETGAASSGKSAGHKSAREMAWPRGENPVKDTVAEASEDSFPASDAPAWT